MSITHRVHSACLVTMFQSCNVTGEYTRMWVLNFGHFFSLKNRGLTRMHMQITLYAGTYRIVDLILKLSR